MHREHEASPALQDPLAGMDYPAPPGLMALLVLQDSPVLMDDLEQLVGQESMDVQDLQDRLELLDFLEILDGMDSQD